MTADEVDCWIDGENRETIYKAGIKADIFYSKTATTKKKEETKQKTRDLIQAIKEGRAKIVKASEVEKTAEKENVEPTEQTIRELIPSPPREPIILRTRKGIQKVETKVMTDPEAMNIIRENHEKKVLKRKQQAKNEQVAKKAITENRRMTLRQKKGLKKNPKL